MLTRPSGRWASQAGYYPWWLTSPPVSAHSPVTSTAAGSARTAARPPPAPLLATHGNRRRCTPSAAPPLPLRARPAPAPRSAAPPCPTPRSTLPASPPPGPRHSDPPLAAARPAAPTPPETSAPRARSASLHPHTTGPSPPPSPSRPRLRENIVIVVSATVAPLSPLKRTLCAAANVLRTSTPPTRPPGDAATGKGASKGPPENNVVNFVPCLPANGREKWIRCSLISPKVRRGAPTLRRPAHLPCAHPPPPVPISPPYARATLVPRRAAALSSRKRARCRVRIGAPYVPQREDRRTLCAPSSACYAPHGVDLRVGSAHLMCILTPARATGA